MNRRHLKTILFIPFFSTLVHAATPRLQVDLDRNQGQVEFLAVGHPSFLKIKGQKGRTGGKLLVAGNVLSGTLSVELDAFDTGMALRNEHMKEKYLETAKFPKALLKLDPLTLPVNFATDTQAKLTEVPFTGKLKLHGVVRPVKGTATVQRSGPQVRGEARFSVDLTAHGIAIPSFKGITVAKEVSITAHIQAPLHAVK